MISKTKQQWTVGSKVKVGFLSDLLVVVAIATPGDYAPDAYLLSRNNQFYSFVPHNGISKISAADAVELVTAAKLQAERAAVTAISKAADGARHAAVLNEMMVPA